MDLWTAVCLLVAAATTLLLYFRTTFERVPFLGSLSRHPNALKVVLFVLVLDHFAALLWKYIVLVFAILIVVALFSTWFFWTTLKPYLFAARIVAVSPRYAERFEFRQNCGFQRPIPYKCRGCDLDCTLQDTPGFYQIQEDVEGGQWWDHSLVYDLCRGCGAPNVIQVDSDWDDYEEDEKECLQNYRPVIVALPKRETIDSVAPRYSEAKKFRFCPGHGTFWHEHLVTLTSRQRQCCGLLTQTVEEICLYQCCSCFKINCWIY